MIRLVATAVMETGAKRGLVDAEWRWRRDRMEIRPVTQLLWSLASRQRLLPRVVAERFSRMVLLGSRENRNLGKIGPTTAFEVNSSRAIDGFDRRIDMQAICDRDLALPSGGERYAAPIPQFAAVPGDQQQRYLRTRAPMEGVEKWVAASAITS